MQIDITNLSREEKKALLIALLKDEGIVITSSAAFTDTRNEGEVLNGWENKAHDLSDRVVVHTGC